MNHSLHRTIALHTGTLLITIAIVALLHDHNAFIDSLIVMPLALAFLSYVLPKP